MFKSLHVLWTSQHSSYLLPSSDWLTAFRSSTLQGCCKLFVHCLSAPNHPCLRLHFSSVSLFPLEKPLSYVDHSSQYYFPSCWCFQGPRYYIFSERRHDCSLSAGGTWILCGVCDLSIWVSPRTRCSVCLYAVSLLPIWCCSHPLGIPQDPSQFILYLLKFHHFISTFQIIWPKMTLLC